MGEWKQPDTMERWPKEVVLVHRAMLLWLMQHPGSSSGTALGRSKRAVARAVGRSEGCVREWAKTHRWEARGATVHDAERTAAEMYRRDYMEDFGRTELPCVMDRVVVSIHTKPSALGGDSADDVITRARQSADAAVRVEQAVLQGVADRRRAERGKVEQFRGLIDAALAETARLLRDKKLRLTAKDIPSLLQARHVITEWMNTNDDRHIEQKNAVESARVKHAREIGGDLIEAMWQDLEEMRTILGALRSRRDDTVEVKARQEYEAVVAATRVEVDVVDAVD